MSWLGEARSYVRARVDAGQLPHALLLGGEEGVGKRNLAAEIARFLVCDHLGASALDVCGTCKHCELIRADSHPDVRYFAPVKSRMIKIDQVRALSSFAVASPQVARRKVIIVDRADQLNINAGNALLKTLEEPSGDVVLLLLQETGRPVLPTIRSRCQNLAIPTPGPDVGLRWLSGEIADLEKREELDERRQRQALELAGHAPRLALEYIVGDFLSLRADALAAFRRFMKSEIPVAEAAKPFKTLGLDATLWLMEVWVADLARIGAGGQARDSEASDMLNFLASSNPAHRAHWLRDAIHESRSATIYNASPELEAERLLIHWRSLMPERRRKSG
ncbi:DNA polymerase III subunit delta' [Marinobacter caseinilyticus]|uniref:DNA polymerase III subunit delta' n=1 Tax=Marinobacter caseinilyticus TaxID=2692195 RepID=UPI0014080D58|nr:DNA polymerase III subunit delta' [Marinobacter caseinilyticus]